MPKNSQFLDKDGNRVAWDDVPLVLMVGHLHTGGAERVVAAMANAWSAQGRKVHIVLTSERNTPLQAEYKVDAQIKRHYVGRKQMRWWHFIYSPWAKPIALWLVDKLHSVLSRLGTYGESWAIAIARWRYAKVITRLQSLFAEIQPPVVMAFAVSIFPIAFLACDSESINVVAMERSDPARAKIEVEKRIFRKLMYGRADLITANSQSSVKMISKSAGTENVVYLPNPLYNHELLQEPIDVGARPHHILIVARLVPQKNHEVLLRAFAKLPEHLQDWRLSVVGDGVHREYLMNLAEQLKISERIDWHGYMPNPFPYYRRASIFVLPSQYEGQSNAVLEAMSLGLPVIVSDTPTLAEMVDDGTNGVVVRCGDVDSLAAALVQLASDCELRERLGKGGRERVMMRHDMPAVLRVWDATLMKASGFLDE